VRFAAASGARDRSLRGLVLATVVGVLLAVVSGCSVLEAGLSSVPLPLRLALASAGGLASPSLPSTPSPSPDRTPRAATGRSLPAGYTYRGSSKRKWIALTFDEDVRPGMYAVRNKTRWYDPRIIDLLERTGTPATIFLNGLFAKAYPKVLQRLAANPNIELANHSWDHQGWTATCGPNDPLIVPPMTKRQEVTATARIVKRLTGIKLRYFRFPNGCHTTADVRLVRSLGEASIGWSCAFGDGLGLSASRQVRNVQQTCGRGMIVVTHLDGPPYHQGVYEALKQLIPWWKSHGWRVVTVGTMLGAPTGH
jgi:peptidoglycan/xylan/chitin deacetylase (PgdA/CDA1 family)